MNTSALGGVSKQSKSADCFSKSVKDLNGAFISSCRAAISRNPSHSLIPLVKDYLFHTRVLMEQYGLGSDSVGFMNGVNSPSKSFQSLGEFFDEFEQNYVSMEGTVTKIPAVTSTPSSAGSEKNTFNFMASPSNFKGLGSSITATVDSPFKSTIPISPSSSPSTLKNALEVNKMPTITSFPLTAPSTNSPGNMPSVLSTPPTKLPSSDISKPKAPFSGFSFFNAPATNIMAMASSSNTSLASSASITSNAIEKPNDEEDGEDEEPPKVEITPVTEDDSVYSIRCKVFGVVDGKCKDKGIGMLYVKKIEGGKYQMVVRADNNLGTVILNILLQKTLPLEKNSKNSVMTVDLQANNQKGMPIFLKVKSEDDATELLNKLKEFQQLS